MLNVLCYFLKKQDEIDNANVYHLLFDANYTFYPKLQDFENVIFSNSNLKEFSEEGIEIYSETII